VTGTSLQNRDAWIRRYEKRPLDALLDAPTWSHPACLSCLATHCISARQCTQTEVTRALDNSGTGAGIRKAADGARSPFQSRIEYSPNSPIRDRGNPI